MSVFESNDTIFAANIIILKDGREMLLQQRKNCFGDGYWALPGGKIKNAETIEEAIAREGAEELGIEISTPNIEVVNIGQTMNSRHMLQIGALVHSYRGQIRIAEPELCAQLRYFDEASLPGNLFLGTEGNIRKFFAKQRYALDANITPDAKKSNEDMPIIVNLIIVDASNHILLKRSISGIGSGSWGLHSGRVKFGETIEAAAARIICDALGIFVDEKDIIFNNFCMPIYNGQNIIEVGVIVRHKINEYLFPRLNEEAQYMLARSFPVTMAKISNPNLENYYSNVFYSESKRLTYGIKDN
jgi:ADP-ribose pyrophosphatase YjhB (NUDIX family)